MKSAGIAERSLQQDYDEEVAFHAARKIFARRGSRINVLSSWCPLLLHPQRPLRDTATFLGSPYRHDEIRHATGAFHQT